MTEAWRSEKVRQPRSAVQPLADMLAEFFDQQGVEYHFGGSWRRGAETVGDLDVLLITESGHIEADLFSTGVDLPPGVNFQRKGKQIAQGDYVLPNGVTFHVDFWVAKPNERGAYLWFITGPKELNVSMRAEAKRKGLSLSQIGLLDRESQQQLDNGTEEDIARILEMPYLTPEQRERWTVRPVRGSDTRQVPSSDGKRSYTLTYHPDHIECTCTGFHYRGDCRHVKEALSYA